MASINRMTHEDVSTNVSARDILENLSLLVVRDGDDKKDRYRIGDLAREFDISLRTLRFYEDRGLLQPVRAGSTRLYSPEDRERLKIILLVKSVGFSLVDIQEFLEIYDKSDSVNGIKFITDKFKTQLSVLESQKSRLEQSITNLEIGLRDIQQID
ncbi:MAG: MerR family transcriptional regulator [Pseudomonadota bacterium]